MMASLRVSYAKASSATKSFCLHITIRQTKTPPPLPPPPIMPAATRQRRVRFDLPESPAPELPAAPCSQNHCRLSRHHCRRDDCDSALRTKRDHRKERRTELLAETSGIFSMIKERTTCIMDHCDLSDWESRRMRHSLTAYKAAKGEKVDDAECYCVQCHLDLVNQVCALLHRKIEAARERLAILGDYRDGHDLETSSSRATVSSGRRAEPRRRSTARARG